MNIKTHGVKATPQPSKAIIYIRVSTEQQGEHGTSLTSQLETCLRKAKEIGAEVVSVAEEVKSGGLYHTREKLQNALALIERGEANVLLLAKLDRTGRELESLRDIRRRIERAGAQMVFADGMQFEQNAIGNLLFTQLGAFAEFEKETIRERMVLGLERTAKAGKMPSRSQCPFGYLIVTKAHVIRGDYPAGAEGTYVPVEDQAQHIPFIFEAIARGQSIRSLAMELDGRGIKPRQANNWSFGTLRDIVRNPLYKGRPEWRKTSRHTDEKRADSAMNAVYRRPRPASQRIAMDAPALVDESLWRRANAVLEAGRAERSGHQKRRHLLVGFARCSICGGRMHARVSVFRLPDDARRRALRYRCSRGESGGCSAQSFQGPELENLVIEALQILLNDAQMMESAHEHYLGEQKKKRAALSEEISLPTLRKRLERAKAKERAIAESLVDARMNGRDGSAFGLMQTEAETASKALENQIAAAEKQNLPLHLETPLPLIGGPLDLVTLFGSEALSAVEKGLALRQLVSRVYPMRFCDTKVLPEKHPGHDRNGQSMRNLAGVQIVLQAGSEVSGEGPLYVLRHVVIDRVRERTAGGRKRWKDEWKVELALLDADPFPGLPASSLTAYLDRT